MQWASPCANQCSFPKAYCVPSLRRGNMRDKHRILRPVPMNLPYLLPPHAWTWRACPLAGEKCNLQRITLGEAHGWKVCGLSGRVFKQDLENWVSGEICPSHCSATNVTCASLEAPLQASETRGKWERLQIQHVMRVWCVTWELWWTERTKASLLDSSWWLPEAKHLTRVWWDVFVCACEKSPDCQRLANFRKKLSRSKKRCLWDEFGPRPLAWGLWTSFCQKPLPFLQSYDCLVNCPPT